MAINHNQIKTISTYITKEKQNASKITKSSSSSTLINGATQKKYNSKINHPSNLTAITPMKSNQALPNTKLQFNEPKIMQKASKTRNAFQIFNHPNTPFIFKSFDTINQYQAQFKNLGISRGFGDFNNGNLKIKACRKPFNDKYLSFLDKKYSDLKQQLSDNCIFFRNHSVNCNNNCNNSNVINIRLSKSIFSMSPNRRITPRSNSVARIIADYRLLSPTNDIVGIETNDKYRKNLTKIRLNGKALQFDAKETKHSDLKTDTDSKGRNSNNHFISETSRMTNRTVMNIKVQSANDYKIKDKSTIKNVQFNSNIKTIKSQCDIMLVSTQNKQQNQIIHLTPPVFKTGIRLLDNLAKDLSQSLVKSINANYKTKHVFLLSQIKKMNESKKIMCHTSSLNNLQASNNTKALKKRTKKHIWEIDYTELELRKECCLHSSFIAYIYKTYLIIDSYAISDYIFNIKSNLFNNNYLERTIRTAHTKKTNMFKHLTLTKNKEYIKTSLLFLQRFIQNDFNLSNFKHKAIYRTKNTMMRNSMSKSLRILKKKKLNNEKVNLSILQKRHFFVLENDSKRSINKLFASRQSIKDINLSLMLPEIKKLIQDVYDSLYNYF